MIRIIAALLLLAVPVYSQSVSETITTGTDDAWIQFSSLTLTHAIDTIDMGRVSITVGTSTHGIYRFQTVAIPRGSIIDSAFLVFRASKSNSGTTCNLRISGEDTTDATTFSDYTDYANRAFTTATVDWSGVGAWTSGTDYTSPDIKTVIQEIIDDAGVDWPLTTGNDMVLRVANNASSANGAYRQAAGFDGGGGTYTRLNAYYHRPTKDTLVVQGPAYIEDNMLDNQNTGTNYGASDSTYIVHAPTYEPAILQFLMTNCPPCSSLISAGWTVSACSIAYYYTYANNTSGTYPTLAGRWKYKPWYELNQTYSDWHSPDSEWTAEGGANFTAPLEDNAGDGASADRHNSNMSTVTLAAASGWFKLDATTYMQNVLAGTKKMRGIEIRGTGIGMTKPDTLKWLYMSEYTTDLTKRPYWSIVIDSTVSVSAYLQGIIHSPDKKNPAHDPAWTGRRH